MHPDYRHLNESSYRNAYIMLIHTIIITFPRVDAKNVVIDSPWKIGEADQTVIGPQPEYWPTDNSMKNTGRPTNVNMIA